MTAEGLGRGDRRSRHAEREARARRIPVADVLPSTSSAEPAARPAPAPAPTPEPARRTAASEASRASEVLPPAHAAAQVAALDTQDRYIDAAARQMRIDKGDAMGWWKRKFYVVGNALFGSAVGMSAGSLAAKALAGSALAATLPALVLGAAVGIPSVLLARYVLGLNKVDRMAKAGRIAHKGKKGGRKAQRAAERAGGTYAISDAELQRKMAELSKRPSYGAIGAGIAAGAFFGAVSYELHSVGEHVLTNKLTHVASSTGEKVTNGNWWYEQVSWLWNAACGGDTSTKLGTIVPDASSAPVQYSHLGSGKAAQKAVEALSKPPSLDYIMDIKPLVLPPPETLAATHIDASQTLMDKLPTDLANTPSPDTIPLVTDVESVGAEEVETVPEPTFVHSGIESGAEDKLGALPYGEIPHAPLEISYGPDDSFARHGIDGLIRQEFFENIPQPPPIGVQEQFIDAVRRTMVVHPEFAQQLLNTNVDVIHGNDIVFPDRGTLNMGVFGNDDFLRELKDTIVTHEKSFLMKGLEQHQGIDAFIDKLRLWYGES